MEQIEESSDQPLAPLIRVVDLRIREDVDNNQIA